MGIRRTDEFCKDAVRIALASVLTLRQFSDDLGFGLSTLNKLVTAHRATDMISSVNRELAEENERLRRDNPVPKEERAILKKLPSSS